MRKIQKVLTGIFMGGVLLCGVGTGIALAEYSSFSYGGEKKIGWENLVTRELDFCFNPKKGGICLENGYWERYVRISGIEADETVPEGTIRYDVTYNERRTEPFLEFEPGEEDALGEGTENEAEPGIGEETGEEAEPATGEDTRNETGSGIGEETETEGKPAAEQGKLSLRSYSVGSDLEIMMKSKDGFLKELKERKISDYDVAYITNVRIRVNPKTMPYVWLDSR